MRRTAIKSRLHSNFKPPQLATSNQEKENLCFEKANKSECTTAGSDNSLLLVPDRYYTVVFRKTQFKKHKTWDADGILQVKDNCRYCLFSSEAKELAKTTNKSWGMLKEGEEITFQGRDISIVGTINESLFLSGQCFFANGATASTEKAANHTLSKPFKRLKTDSAAPKDTPPKLFQRNDPNAPNAFVLTEPSLQVLKQHGSNSKRAVPVVVDPILSTKLRSHQQEGVRFLYECFMGMRSAMQYGAILADEMGLGKTLQTIATIWTMLKQTPFADRKPILKRVLIVTPATLVHNWKNEFQKWLGQERIQVFAVDCDSRIADFKLGRVYTVMVIGYERLRLLKDELKSADFDLIVCDEGHRLKSATIKTVQAIKSLPCKRRLILSGTPIQNDLSEFFAMVDFVNPGILGTWQTFKRVFGDVIAAGRDSSATSAQTMLCEERSTELVRITGQFVLRRTNEAIKLFLPPKTELVLFAPLHELQVQLYEHILAAKGVVGPSMSDKIDQAWVLSVMTLLKKVCNSPLLAADEFGGRSSAGELDSNDLYCSSKMAIVKSLLQSFSKSGEKTVLVSNYTQTLDLLERLCTDLSLPFLRLDGTTNSAKRIELVNSFNSTLVDKCAVFLLSSKAGGTGINLVGASRLVLFDLDWNPSVDAQAMARIWREGQNRPVFIYRLLAVGTIEEKIFQRQLSKLGLSRHVLLNSSVGIESKKPLFSKQDLRDLFTYQPCKYAQTFQLLTESNHGTEDAVRISEELTNWEAFKMDSEIDRSAVLAKDSCLQSVLDQASFLYIS